jgi:hypothetical protein
VSARQQTEAERHFLSAHQQPLHGRTVASRCGAHKRGVLGSDRMGTSSTCPSLFRENTHTTRLYEWGLRPCRPYSLTEMQVTRGW